jgi:hypothetical protein
MPSTHSTPYGYDVGNHTYHQNRADASGNLLCGIAGTWADAVVEDTDQIVSKLTDISQHTNLCQSRLDNIQIDLAASEILQTSTNTKLDTLETTNNAIETLITASNVDLAALEVLQTTTNSNLVTIDTAVDLNNSRGDELYMDTHVAQISNGAIAQWALMSASGGAEVDMVGSTGYQYRDVTIYGKTTSSTAKLHFAGASSSGGTFYINPTYASLQADNSSNYHFIMTWENCPFRYVDVLASVAPAGLYISTIKSKHR